MCFIDVKIGTTVTRTSDTTDWIISNYIDNEYTLIGIDNNQKTRYLSVTKNGLSKDFLLKSERINLPKRGAILTFKSDAKIKVNGVEYVLKGSKAIVLKRIRDTHVKLYFPKINGNDFIKGINLNFYEIYYHIEVSYKYDYKFKNIKVKSIGENEFAYYLNGSCIRYTDFPKIDTSTIKYIIAEAHADFDLSCISAQHSQQVIIELIDKYLSSYLNGIMSFSQFYNLLSMKE